MRQQLVDIAAAATRWRPPSRCGLLLIGVALAGCAAAPETEPEPAVRLWHDWRALGARPFEERLAEGARTGLFPLGSEDRRALVAALGEPVGTSATRAAVLLAHSAAAGDDEAREALLARLERRGIAPSRSEAAGDVVAAAALAPHAQATRAIAERLAALASGPRPHPELDVRVECAVSALGAGRREVAPFLLAVLRAETPGQGTPDWPRTTSLAWAKGRAGDALAAFTGIPVRVRPDASWADQLADAERFEAALR